MKEWNWERNNQANIYPTAITKGINKKVWWKCNICGHEWQATVGSRSGDQRCGCPKCKKDLSSSFPEKAIAFYLSKFFLSITVSRDISPTLFCICPSKSPTQTRLTKFPCTSACSMFYFYYKSDKKGGILIYERMLSESIRLDKQISHLQNQLRSLPDGKLVCTKNQNRYKWYVSDGHKCTYIPKKNLSLAQQLAIKKFLTSTL